MPFFVFTVDVVVGADVFLGAGPDGGVVVSGDFGAFDATGGACSVGSVAADAMGETRGESSPLDAGFAVLSIGFVAELSPEKIT